MKVQSINILVLLFFAISSLDIRGCDSARSDQNDATRTDEVVSQVFKEASHRVRRAVRGPQLSQQPKRPKVTSTTTSTTTESSDDLEDDESYPDTNRPKPKNVNKTKLKVASNKLGDDDEDDDDDVGVKLDKPVMKPKGRTEPKSVTISSDSANDDDIGTNSDSDTNDDDTEEMVESTTQAIQRASKKASKNRPSKATTTNLDPKSKASVGNESATKQVHHKHPMIHLPLPLPKTKNTSVCIPEAYKEFPDDLIGNKWRARGLVIIHIGVVCYMFYALALICEKYFMPSLEEFSQRLGLSEDVAGATLMSAGSSAPELFTAIIGVFLAKGDVGTGAIVGSAVFNILFVIGVCAFVSTTSAQLSWWPVLRDSVFYTLTVLVLIMFIWDEEISAIESFLMIVLYGVYIEIMRNNQTLKNLVTNILLSNPNTAKLISSAINSDNNNSDDVFASGSHSTIQMTGVNSKTIEEDSMYLAACLIIMRHKRLFSSNLRFQSAARYIILKRKHKLDAQKEKQKQTQLKCSDEVNYFGPENEPLNTSKSSSSQRQRIEAYTRGAALSKNKFSIVSRDDYEFWNRPPEEGENYYLWLARIPINYVLHYTVPDCALYPDKYLITFFLSIAWTAFFSYIMVWMVTLIGYTLGIPDSIMGFTFLAAGTSVPDCYSSIHAARNGMADMAVSNSIGSNVFDILIGLGVPWFIHTTIHPRVEAKINSVGIIYSVVLLFLSLLVTIYLLNKYEWTLKPRLGLAMLIAYSLFIVLTCMLEFNMFGHVNPPPC